MYQNFEKTRTVIYGTGGHAKIIKEILNLQNICISCFMDFAPEKTSFLDTKVIHENSLENENKPFDKVIIAIGKNSIRRKVTELFNKHNIPFIKAVHPEAIVSKSSQIGKGTVIVACARIAPNVTIGESVIVNTGALVDHDSTLHSFSQVAPNVTICGNVTVGEMSYIGAGATVIQGITIGSNCMIGAGAVVTKDVPDNVLVVGIPAAIKDSWPVKGKLK